MKKYDKHINDVYIEWVVAIAVVFATTFFMAESFLELFYPFLGKLSGIIRNLFLLLLLFYQIKNYGIKIFGRKGFIFFLIYSVYILLYITVFPVYKLDDLVKAPSSVLNFFYRTIQISIYLLCADTIYYHLKVSKFLLLSLFAAVIPSLVFIHYVGIDTLQLYGQDEDGEFISSLTIGYCSAPILVATILFYFRSFKNRWLSIAFSTIIVVLTLYVIGIAGERGPIIWSIANLVICVFILTKNKVRYFVILLLIGSFIFVNIDGIISGLEKITPHTAEKIESTVKEKDTNGRFDLSNRGGSTYIIGINQFLSSPLYGSYFRLITSHPVFRGHYPHNVFIEILMTMGLLGFIPFIYLLLYAWRLVKKRIKGKYLDNQMICLILFLAAFLQLQTSETVVFNTAFWCFFFILCNIDLIEKKKVCNSNHSGIGSKQVVDFH